MTDTVIEALELPTIIMGNQTSIYPTLIWDSDTTILVDAGFTGQSSAIKQAIMKTGKSFEKLDKIIVTHHDRDHIGSLRSLLHDLPSASVLSHEAEKPYIEGNLLPCKVTMADAPDSQFPPPVKAAFQAQKLDYLDYAVPVDETLYDGQELPYCGGIKVVHTPGHTPGHICLYLTHNKTLIAGDALCIEGGKLNVIPHFTSFDPYLAIKSLEKLSQYVIETVFCYHGGVWRGNADQFTKELSDIK
ncbi:MAG TPA: MBL fold metallo-hydrolase [Syntrophorhabdaceae bacterium]|nr:MBL fold metallo-hydrolase [Syntrophorhabdaceae bacterium]